MDAMKVADISLKCFDRINNSPVPVALFYTRGTVKATRTTSDLYKTAEEAATLIGIYDHDAKEEWIYEDVQDALRGVA